VTTHAVEKAAGRAHGPLLLLLCRGFGLLELVIIFANVSAVFGAREAVRRR
jgi:hypothetical protein